MPRNYTLEAWDLARADETLRDATSSSYYDGEHINAIARVIDVLTEEFEPGDTITVVDTRKDA